MTRYEIEVYDGRDWINTNRATPRGLTFQFKTEAEISAMMWFPGRETRVNPIEVPQEELDHAYR